MADTVIGALRVLLGLDTAAFSSGAKEAQGALGQLEKAVTGGLKNMAGALGVGLSVGAIVGQFKNAVNAADELFKASQKFGVGVESLGALRYAAELADVSFEALGKGLKKLAQATVDGVVKPNGEAAASFATLGISMEDIKGASPEQVLLKVADAFSKFDDDATKTTVAVNLFGKAGADLIPLLNQGSAGINKTTEEARKLGLVVSTETAKGAEEFNDALKKVGSVIPGIANQILRDLAPALKAFTNAVDDFIKTGGIAKLSKQISGSVTNDAKDLTFLSTVADRSLKVISAAFEAAAIASSGSTEGLNEALAKTKTALIDFSKSASDVNFEFSEALEGARNLDTAEQAMNNFSATLKEKLNPNIIAAQQEGGKLIESLKKQVDQQRAAKDSVELSAGSQAAAKITAELFSLAIDKNSDAFKNLKAEIDKYLPQLAIYVNQTSQAQNAKGIREGLEVSNAGLKAELDGIRLTIAEKDKLIEKRKQEIQVQQGKLSNDVKELNSINEQIDQQATLKERLDSATSSKMLDLEIEKKRIEGQINLRAAQGESIEQLARERAELEARFAAKQKNMDQDPAYIANIQRSGEAAAQSAIDLAAFQLVQSNRTPLDDLIKQTETHQAILAKYPQLYQQVQMAASRSQAQIFVDEGKAITQLVSGMGQVFSALGAHNKKAFEASKAFNIAAATMNAFLAFTQVLATSKLPPPFNYALAAATLAVGLAQVIQIKQQQFTGAAMGGSFMVPGGSMGVDTKLIPMHLAPGERVDVTPANQAGSAGEKTLIIPSIKPQEFFTGDVVREMVFQIDEWIKDGGTGVKFANRRT